jgi:hypothetical protein
MAEVGNDFPTYADLGKRMQQGGNEEIAAIIEVLAQTNPIMEDIPVHTCNNGTKHRVTKRSKLPEVFWRSINKGVPASKSETKQFDEDTGQMAVWSHVDRDLAKLNNNEKSFLMSEEAAFLESLNQEMAKNLFYGNKNEFDAKFTGLAPRYSTLDESKSDTAKCIVNAGGTGGTNTSAWLIPWGERTAFGIVPVGMPAGLQREHFKNVEIRDKDGYEFIGHKSYYTWNMGLAIPDHRYIIRVANINVTELDSVVANGAATAASQKLVRLLIDAVNRLPSRNIGNPVWYMGRKVRLALDIMASEKSNVNLSLQEYHGRMIPMFYGYPIREVDAISYDEVAVA